MNVTEIKELVQIVIDAGVAELEVQRGDDRVRIKRTNGTAPPQEIVLAPAGPVVAQPVVPAVAAPQPSAAPTAASATPPKHEEPQVETTLIKSPIVGTFYASGSPGSPPFVRVGDRVRPGQVLCIIESMKLMNEIEAEVSGTIVSQFVENGRPVEYGEALFAVKPD